MYIITSEFNKEELHRPAYSSFDYLIVLCRIDVIKSI